MGRRAASSLLLLLLCGNFGGTSGRSSSSVDSLTGTIDRLMQPWLNTADGFFDRTTYTGGFTSFSGQRCQEGGLSPQNFCNGKADCLEKGKAMCGRDSSCKGVMWAGAWEGGKRVQFCKDTKRDRNRDWSSEIKNRPNDAGEPSLIAQYVPCR